MSDVERAVESSLLGAVILAADQQIAVTEVKSILSDTPLSPFAAPVWEAIESILSRHEPADLVMLHGELARRNTLAQIGGIEALARWVETCPNIHGHAHYARELSRLYREKQRAGIIASILEKSKSNTPLNGELVELQKLFENSKEDKPKPKYLTGSQIESKDFGPIDWTLYPLASRGSLTLLHGIPKGGKSSFALHCALSIAKGVWISGTFLISESRKVLYIAYEDNLRRLKDRLLKYNIPFYSGGLPDNFHAYELPPNLAFESSSSVDELISFCRDLGITSIFVDTFSYAHSADENSATEMHPVMKSCRRLCLEENFSVWLLHHSRKPKNENEEGPMISKVRGSSVIGAAPDHVILWGNRAKKNVTRVLFESKDADAAEWNIHYIPQGDQGIAWHVEIVSQEKIINEKLDKVLEALYRTCEKQPEGATAPEVSDLAGIGHFNSVRIYLNLLAEKGHVLKHKAGQKWLYHPLKPNPTTEKL